MKPVYLILLLLAAPLSVLAAENTSPAKPGTDAEDKPFADPFSTEGSPSEQQTAIADPWERMNRTFFKLNQHLYNWVLEPVGKGYKTVTPLSLRESLGRLFTNAKYPVRLANSTFQGKFKGAGIETARFVINSTVGVAGLFDPAAYWKLTASSADFDQTLRFYDVPSGNYLVLPLFGATTVRGTVGLIGDAALNPLTYVDTPATTALAYALPPAEIINKTSLHLGEYEALKNATLDFYAARRSAYFEDLRDGN
jgi:phospholipid-binding lipoprotein MlaA